jgi:hypothetical protein
MNNDDMDDAQFEAFLKGEGSLARRMKALAQPSPSAELDAAILARATLDMAREPRPAAANDAGAASPAPKLGRGLSWRWRVPAGIAATVLAGVIANQSWRDNDAAKLAAQPVLAEAPAAAPEAPRPVTAPPALQDAAARPAPKVRSTAKAAPVPAPAAPVATDSIEARDMAAAPAQAAPAPPPPPPSMEREASLLARQADARQKKEVLAESNKTVASKPAHMLAANEEVIVTGSRARAREPQPWLDQINALLKAGQEAEARQQWNTFRSAYPDHPVPPSMLEHFK